MSCKLLVYQNCFFRICSEQCVAFYCSIWLLSFLYHPITVIKYRLSISNLKQTVHPLKNTTLLLNQKHDHSTCDTNKAVRNFKHLAPVYLFFFFYPENNIIDAVMQRCAQLCIISQMPFPAFVVICLLITSVVKCHK